MATNEPETYDRLTIGGVEMPLFLHPVVAREARAYGYGGPIVETVPFALPEGYEFGESITLPFSAFIWYPPRGQRRRARRREKARARRARLREIQLSQRRPGRGRPLVV